MNPKYPVYVISKGRWESRLTAKALLARNIPFHIVIEPPEYRDYASVIDPRYILQLPFSNLGLGSIPARNWVWEHSINNGHRRHWILDDNIRYFYRLHKNIKYRTESGTTFRVIEDFCDRYKNVAMAGMQYEMFAPRKQKHPPCVLNTRIYSCILLDNAIPYRWRGRYNEDTDLSLRILKAGLCTVLFYAFLAEKEATMTMPGGNTEDLYEQTAKIDGRLKMAQSLRTQHPDVTRIVRRWGRWQHLVDYSPFRGNRLIRDIDVEKPTGINNFGMVLTHKGRPILDSNA